MHKALRSNAWELYDKSLRKRRLLSYNSPNWTRTNDLAVNSRSLYQLSYRGLERGIIAKCEHSPIGVEEIAVDSYNMGLPNNLGEFGALL